VAQTVIGVSPQKPGFDPKQLQAEFMVILWHWNMIFFQYFGTPAQYHSTSTPYLFIHLSPTI